MISMIKAGRYEYEILSACSNLSIKCNYAHVWQSVDFHEIEESLNEKLCNCHIS